MIYSELTALFSVIVIDLVLAGDNAVVVGMAAAGLRHDVRRKAIFYGIASAAVLRIIFALFATRLLDIIPLVIAGGLLLLWVAWKLWREIRHSENDPQANSATADITAATQNDPAQSKTFAQALTQIVVADVSMSLDNVIAVAGTAQHHPWILVAGLLLSIALMGVAATLVARLLRKHPWIAYVGLLLIVWVALRMVWEGAHEAVSAGAHAGLLPPWMR